MLFSELLASWQRSPGRIVSAAPEDWKQGRAMFGGLQAALGLGAMRTLVPALPLRCLQATLLAPASGDTVCAEAKILRQGKSAVHVEARLMEGDQLLGVLIGIFGSARESSVAYSPVQPAVSSAAPRRMPYVAGISPTFTQYFEATWLSGDLPYSGSTAREAVVQINMKDEVPSTEYHVVAIADYIPPVALAFLNKPCNGSTMTWMLEFLTDNLTGLPLEGWRVDAEMQAAEYGYTHQSVMIWAPDGTPVALSRQNMVIFG
ncbi:MAG TPA: thioesterase family protein [Pseudomonadales bacterium]|nr:thioesterase family protein [Pseudomonadales bacterium]